MTATSTARRPYAGGAPPTNYRLAGMGPHAAYELDAWHDFFVTTAGAAAVISGLILVSVSINLREILAWVLPVEVLR